MSALQNKVVLVTGAGKRIGREIALRLAREGAQLAIHYNQSDREAQRTADECGGNARPLQANLEDVAEISRMFDHVQTEFGRLDCLVNNAARFSTIDPLHVTEKDWDFIHAVNLKATFFCAQAAARIMLPAGGGRIVNISSLGGIRPWANNAHYCASKAGVIHMTRALAKAWAPAVTVNSVAPGVIPFGEAGEERVKKMIADTPAKRAGTGQDIAEAVLFFLAGPSFVTGQVLAVDGGLSQK